MRRMWIIAAAVFLLCGCGRQEMRFTVRESAEDAFPETEEGTLQAETEEIPERENVREPDIRVYVCGQVASPGVYTLPEGARAVDAVTAAGGLLPEADECAVNLAEKLSDGMQITVPVKGEAGSASAGNGKVDINRADAEALQTLPGIGPAKAQAIIAYRTEHGPFSDLNEMKKVPGIGDALIEQIRDQAAAG